MALSARLLTLRRSPILLRLPPLLSIICVLAGIAWLLLLPLDEYSRQTYISENAILPGQVHTYFGGSEHNVFRGYRQEVFLLSELPDPERTAALANILDEVGLKAATQDYSFTVAGDTIAGTNVYGLLEGPRSDATEAMALLAAWRNFDGEINYSGVALALTLARYFKRWSIWSKDIMVLIPADSTYGPEAWVSAYHSTFGVTSALRNVSALPIKAGALQGAVAIDYPVGPWGHRFDKLDILYDGINGALPNLDLLNTAVSVASGQVGIGCSLHGLKDHTDSYEDRLNCLAKSIMTQAAGHATGPHSAFMPYHIDAITIKTIGDGWHDEMGLGRVTESLFRSINNLLEHFHQSFFFYFLMNTNRFVSIGSYLPAAMIIAGAFTINALALWTLSGRGPLESPALPRPEQDKPATETPVVVIKDGKDTALIPKDELETIERKTLLPISVLLSVHLVSFGPLHALTYLHHYMFNATFIAVAVASYVLPIYVAYLLVRVVKASTQQIQILQALSLLIFGAVLSTWATLNFSLAFLIGLLAAPLTFVRPLALFTGPAKPDAKAGQEMQTKSWLRILQSIPVVLLYLASSPPAILFALSIYLRTDLSVLLLNIAKGWAIQGSWSNLMFWGVWWPAWVIGGAVLYSGVIPGLT